MTAVPSTWPEIKWPPNRPFEDIARSKFTGLPDVSWSSDVALTVSGITSAANCAFVKLVTVRHTPLIAILSPRWTSSSTWLHWMTISMASADFLLNDWTVPTSSIIPVNMWSSLSFHLYFSLYKKAMLGTCDRLNTFVAFYGPYKVDEGSPNKHCMPVYSLHVHTESPGKIPGLWLFCIRNKTMINKYFSFIAFFILLPSRLSLSASAFHWINR